MAQKFSVVRYFQSGRKYTLATGVSKEDAKTHCGSVEASSAKCTTKVGKERTRNRGQWFDGFILE